jgi:hypothetical protein
MFWKCQVGESELSVGKVQTGQNWKLAYWSMHDIVKMALQLQQKWCIPSLWN